MKYGQDTVDRVRSIMAPGNPVPGDVLSGRQRAPHRQETHDRILASAWTDPTAPPRPPGAGGPGRWRPRGGRAGRVIAPVAAGLAVAGLVTGLALAAGSPAPVRQASHRGARHRGPGRAPLLRHAHVAGSVRPPSTRRSTRRRTGQLLGQVRAGFLGHGIGMAPTSRTGPS